MAADLSAVGPVYFWPMNGALDQYIAQEVSSQNLIGVTVDPAQAKTVMTDHIDSKFFEGMNEVFTVKTEAVADDATEEVSSIESGQTSNRPANRPRGAPMGTVFLVDVQSRQVVWSTFLGEFTRQPKRLHKEARRVVSELRKGVTAE